MQTVKTGSNAKTTSDTNVANSCIGTSAHNATLENSLEIPPQPPILPPGGSKRITWADLSPAQRKYAKQLHIDEGWPLCEAILLAKFDGGAK